MTAAAMSDRYIEAERRLATLRGFYDIEDRIKDGEHIFSGQRKGVWPPFKDWIPRWCRDNEAAFLLMVAHGIELIFAMPQVIAVAQGGAQQIERYDHHHDKAAAVRYAIVQATIKKLESKK